MQINNNMSQQNFGMAFKIKGIDGAEWVSKQERITLDRLAKAAEDLKDTKFYHLFADCDGLYVSKDDRFIYRGYKLDDHFRMHPDILDSNLMAINTRLDINEGKNVNRSISVLKSVADKHLLELTDASDEVGKLVALTKALDAEANYKHAVDLAKEAAEVERKNLANELINKFSVEA